MSSTTTGRPLRALTLIIAALAGWAAARLPEAMATPSTSIGVAETEVVPTLATSTAAAGAAGFGAPGWPSLGCGTVRT